MEDMLRAVLDETLRPVLTTRGRGEVMSRLRPVVRLLLDRQAQEIADALEEMVPLWSANTASMGDGIDQRRAVDLARNWGNR